MMNTILSKVAVESPKPQGEPKFPVGDKITPADTSFKALKKGVKLRHFLFHLSRALDHASQPEGPANNITAFLENNPVPENNTENSDSAEDLLANLDALQEALLALQPQLPEDLQAELKTALEDLAVLRQDIVTSTESANVTTEPLSDLPGTELPEETAGTQTELPQAVRDLVAQLPPKAQEVLKTVLEAHTEDAPQPELQKNLDRLTQLLEKMPPQTKPVLEKVIEDIQSRLNTVKTEDSAPPQALPSETPRLSPQEQAIQRLEALLEKVPLQAQEAIQETLTRLESGNTNRQERMPGKSISQIQLEALFDQQPAAPEAMPIGEGMMQDTTEEGGQSFNSPTSSPASMLLSSLTGAQRTEGVTQNGPAFNVAHLQNPNQPQNINPPHQQVVEAAKMTVEAGKTEISIKLAPDHLGSVRLILNSNTQNEVTAKLITQTAEAKDALEKTLDQLVKSLESQGVKLARVSIVQAGAETADSRNDQQYQPGQQSSQQNSLSQQQSGQQHAHDNPFATMNGNLSGSFTDGGSSQAGDDASSTQAFDTDVEGEEVLSEFQAGTSGHEGSVDIRA